jgi:hypothetical protein
MILMVRSAAKPHLSNHKARDRPARFGASPFETALARLLRVRI